MSQTGTLWWRGPSAPCPWDRVLRVGTPWRPWWRVPAVPVRPPPASDRLSPLSVPGRSVDPGLAGLLGRRAPRSKQPFLVTFFRASPGPVRAPRAARPLKRRPPKKSNELPHPNRLPGIFGEVRGGPGPGRGRGRRRGPNPRGLSGVKPVVTLQCLSDTCLPRGP